MTNIPNSGQFEEGEFVPTNAPTLTAPVNTAVAEHPPTHPSNTAPPSLNNLDIANLAGLKPSNPAQMTVAEENDDIVSVEDSRTKLPIYKRSMFKIAVIAACLGLMGITIIRLMFPPDPTTAVVASPAKQPEKSPVAEFAPDPKMGILASKNALRDQTDGIIAARAAQQKAAKEAADKAAATPNVTPSAIAPPAVRPVVSSNSQQQLLASQNPQPVPVYQPRRVVKLQPQASPVPIPTIRPLPQPARIVTRQPIQPQPVRIAAKPVIQPQPARIAKLITVKTPVKPTPPMRVARIAPNALPIVQPPAAITWEMANSNAVGTWGRSNKVELMLASNTAAAPAPTNTNIAQTLQSNPNDGTFAQVAVVGQQIRAKTIIPYQVTAANKTQSLVFSLASALVDTSGAAILPAGSQILADISTQDSGLMQIENAKALTNGRSIDLPKQSLMLQNASKQPLMAQSQDSGNGGFGRTLANIGAGAAQAVGQNMLQSSTNLITNGITVQSNTTPNLLGAALYGGLNPVLAQMQIQNQPPTNQLTTKVWLLPSGTEVNLIVAQPFRI